MITRKESVIGIVFMMLFQGFFEEIEDLKFALQQSALLNREYEKTLKNLCLRFGIPYPRPEQLLSNN